MLQSSGYYHNRIQWHVALATNDMHMPLWVA